MERNTYTRRQRPRSLRVTQKRQRGGVRLDNWPDVGDRSDEWKSALATSVVAKDLETLFMPKDETNDTKPEHLELWFRVLERQDDLFDIALEIMTKKVVDGSGSEFLQKIIATDPATIEEQRAKLVAYLTDVEKMVNFNHDTGKTGTTKLHQIIDNKSEPLLSLFLFPNRVHNMFIESLANIFVALKNDSQMLTHIKNPFLATVVAAQYKSYVLSNSMTTTGMIQRDGYYLDYPCTKLKNDFVANISDTFYITMLTEIDLDLQYDELFSNKEGCTYYIDDWGWPKIAAHIFLAYKAGGLTDILKRFNTECSPQPAKRPQLQTKYYPHEYMDIVVRGVQFGTLLSNMSYMKLEFILQLCYKIGQANLLEIAVPTIQTAP